ncbi:MAG: tetratricopeptide repeat protein, partial [Reichenbachiella sp.]
MKRIIVLLCLMILSNLCSQAQEKSKPTVRIKMDSLMSQLSPLNEAGKAKAFNEYFHGYIQQNIDEAYQALELIEERSREEKDTSILINSLVLTAEYYWRKGAYKDGIVYGLEAVKLAESNARFEYELARSYQNLGTIHLFLYNREAAVKYYKQASKLFFKLGDVKSLCSIYNNTGVAYMDAAKMKTNTIFTDSALFYFEKTINQKGKARVSTVLNALGNSGGIYVIQENWSKAKTIFDEWIELEKANKNISARAMIYGNIGVMHLRLRNYTLAEKYLYEGLDLAIGLGSKFEIQEYYHYLSELNESKGSYKEALDYNNKWVSLKDSIYNADKVTQINELETKYDTDKKEQQITQLEQENIIQELEAQRQKQLKTFSVIAVGLLLLAVGLLYSRYRSKNKTN